MSDELKLAKQAMASIPVLQGLDAEPVRLGGLTNLVFQVGDYCLRIPGAGTDEYINRADEAVAAKEAARSGVSPEVLYFDPDTGVMVSRLIADGITLSPALFASRQGAPARAGKALRQLHSSDAEFPFHFELFAMIDEYLGILSGKDVALPEGYHDVVAEAESVRAALAMHPAKLAACHSDPLCENFLDTDDKMWIVDWEYSGMNDPLWDLGDLSVEASMTDAQDTEMMTAYFGRFPTAAETGRMVIYKAMCDLLWTLWGLIQLADENPAEDFWAYSTGRFDRCKTLLQGRMFEQHLEAVRKG